MAPSLKDSIFKESKENVQTALLEGMKAKYREETGTEPDEAALPVMTENANLIGSITAEEAKKLAQQPLEADATPASVSKTLAKNVAARLDAIFDESTPLMMAAAFAGGKETFLPQVEAQLEAALKENLEQHRTELAEMTHKQESPPSQTASGKPDATAKPKENKASGGVILASATQPAADAQQSSPPPPAFQLPDSLIGIANSPSSGMQMITAFSNKEALKGVVRESASKMGQEFTEADIDKMAGLLQEAGTKWWADVKKAESEGKLKLGELNREQIRDLSQQLAVSIRTQMTPDRVGAFADSKMLGMVSIPETLTGVDKAGKVSNPYGMNIFGIAEATLAANMANEETQERYLQELAYEESNRRWREGNGAYGLSSDAAARNAASIAANHGYDPETQAAVGNMANRHFRMGLWDGILSFIEGALNSIIGAIANFFGANMPEGHKFVELNNWQNSSAQKNANLFKSIVNEQDPGKLGYTGNQQGFYAWKEQLATDVTGIHLSRDGYLIDHTNGHVNGLNAVLQGMSPDGRGTAPGTENIDGFIPEAARRNPTLLQSPVRRISTDQPHSNTPPPTQQEWYSPDKPRHASVEDSPQHGLGNIGRGDQGRVMGS